MLDEIVLQKKVAGATRIIKIIEMSPNRKGVLIKSDGGIAQKEAFDVVGVLLSGYYTEKSTQNPYCRLDKLHVEIESHEGRMMPPDEITLVLRSDYPNSNGAKRTYEGYRYLRLCYFEITPARNIDKFDYEVRFSRRNNNFAKKKFKEDKKLSMMEARGFYTYVTAQKQIPVGLPSAPVSHR